jgi:hypothetical protein
VTRHCAQFKKGEPRPANSGRRAGTPNKRTVFVKGILEDAAIEIGGLQRLVKWIKDSPQNEYAFWTSMFMRLLPVQLQGAGQNGELVMKISREELARKLEERGLPTTIFGADVPMRPEEVTGRFSTNELRHRARQLPLSKCAARR